MLPTLTHWPVAFVVFARAIIGVHVPDSNLLFCHFLFYEFRMYKTLITAVTEAAAEPSS